MSHDASLPRRPEQHAVGDAAIVLVEALLPRQWIVRRQDGHGDYGIDLEIEVAHSNVSGNIFKAQVRGHDGVRWAGDGTYLQAVRAETLTYWRAIPLPVVLFVVDVACKEAHWALVGAEATEQGVRVRRDCALSRTTSNLEADVVGWLRQRGAQAMRAAVPVFVGRWKAAQERTDRDCFLPVRRSEYVELLWLYNQTILLREAVALPHSQLIPWEVWIGRAQATFGDMHTLYYAMHDEVVAYLEPFVTEALDRVAAQLVNEFPTAENFVAMSWAEAHRGNPDYSYAIRSELADLPISFWEEMDEHLTKLGARRLLTAEMIRARPERR